MLRAFLSLCAQKVWRIFRKFVRISLDRRENPWHIYDMKRTAKRAMTVSEAKKAILAWFDDNDPFRTHGPHVPAKIRRELGIEKAVFDAAVVELLRERTVYCAEHDHPWRLRPEERDELVADGRGVFYVTISDRRPARPLPAEAIPA
jgi:hypothetical protein